MRRARTKWSLVLLLCIVILLMQVAGIADEIEDEGFDKPAAGENNLEDKVNLFEVQPRIEPLTICTGWKGGFKWKPPKIPKCEISSEAEIQETTIFNLTTWWPVITSQSIKGYSCRAVDHEVRKSWFFWGTYSDSSTAVPYHLSEYRCEIMTSTISDFATGLPLLPLRNGVWSNEKVREFKYSWPQTNTYKWTDQYVIEYTIAIRPDSDNIFTAADIVKDCKVQDKKCKTKDGWLMWKIDNYKSCFLKPLPTVLCTITGNMITCPSKSIALSNVRSETSCGLKIGQSDQGVMFTPDEKVDNKFLSDLDITSSFYPIIVESKSARQKRSAQFGNVASTNAQLQYIYEMVRHNTSVMILDVHKKICLNNAMLLNTNLNHAKNGYPTALVESIFGAGYKAAWNGDVLSITRCSNVTTYGFSMHRTKCMEEWDVSYTLPNSDKIHYGYMTGSHEISTLYTPVDCEKVKPFYFTYLDQAYQLSSLGSPMDIPTMPNPGLDDLNFDKMPEIAVQGPAMYDSEEFGDLTTTRAIMRELHRGGHVDRALVRVKQGKDTFAGSALEDIHDIIVKPYIDFLKMVGFIVVGFIVFVVVVYVVYWFGIFHLCCHSCRRVRCRCHIRRGSAGRSNVNQTQEPPSSGSPASTTNVFYLPGAPTQAYTQTSISPPIAPPQEGQASAPPLSEVEVQNMSAE